MEHFLFFLQTEKWLWIWQMYTVPSEEDTVTVTLSSGTQIEGTVEKVSDDGCAITMTDSGVGLGDTATVTDEKETVLAQEPSISTSRCR